MDSGQTRESIGVILLNLGGPDRLQDVEPFLFNLFSDRKIIRLSPFPFLQKFIARRIARKRAPKSSIAYGQIGGASPLKSITAAQGRALAELLAPHGDFRVAMAMRYWHPFAADTLQDFQRACITRIVALTLYPHYSIATTGSSLDDLRAAAANSPAGLTIAEVRSWPQQPEYIAALAETIMEGFQRFNADDKVQLVYSAHSLPVKFIEEGDPYLDEIKATINAVEKRTGRAGRLCFQSRSGPVKWLSPSTPDMLEELAAQGCRHVLMVPISFVSDHVETLYEIDIQYRELALSLGMRLERSASLNTRPRFIAALKELVLEACREHQFIR